MISMGYINVVEQGHIKELYGHAAEYRCNECNRLIWVHEMPVVDPKGGYYELPPSINSFGSRYSRPKVTFCTDCDLVRRGKKKKEKERSEPTPVPVTKKVEAEDEEEESDEEEEYEEYEPVKKKKKLKPKLRRRN